MHGTIIIATRITVITLVDNNNYSSILKGICFIIIFKTTIPFLIYINIIINVISINNIAVIINKISTII